MSKYILETNELTKVFGKQKAVNNVSLKIEENSVKEPLWSTFIFKGYEKFS